MTYDKQNSFRLEYRLLDEKNDYPILYYYEAISAAELSLRLSCGRFVKEGRAYEKTSAAQDVMQYVIYLKPAELLLDRAWLEAAPKDSYFELRRLTGKKGDAPLLNSCLLEHEQELQLKLLCDYHFFFGTEWLVQAVELDEDRACYVCYLKRAVGEDDDAQLGG